MWSVAVKEHRLNLSRLTWVISHYNLLRAIDRTDQAGQPCSCSELQHSFVFQIFILVILQIVCYCSSTLPEEVTLRTVQYFVSTSIDGLCLPKVDFVKSNASGEFRRYESCAALLMVLLLLCNTHQVPGRDPQRLHRYRSRS